MGRVAAVILLALCAGITFFSCDDERDEVSIPSLDGKWDMLLIPQDMEEVSYTVTVSTGGPSGSAYVSTETSDGDTFAAEVVLEGEPVAVGACGATVTFSDTAGKPLYLAEGDYWTIQVVGAEIFSPAPSPDNSSTVDSVISGGDYTCYSGPCSEGIFGAGIAPAASEYFSVLQGQVEFPFIKVEQEDANFGADLPELSALSLYLMEHEPGDIVTLSYRRSITLDGTGGDFFAVRVYNGPVIQTAEEFYADGAAVTASSDTVSYSFTSFSDVSRVDFIFGLSASGDEVLLDQVMESVNGSEVFSDNFDGPDFIDDVAGDGVRWEPRRPARMAGGMDISATGAIEGAYSVLAQGGMYRYLSGSILAQSTTSIMGITIPEGSSDGSFGGIPSFFTGSDTVDLTGVNFSITEQQSYGYYSSFGGLLENEDAVFGSFKGESSDLSCTEQGQFFAAIGNELVVQAEGDWQLTLSGDVQNCGDITEFMDVIGPFSVNQEGQYLSLDPASEIIDSYGNSYDMQGSVYGQLMYFMLGDAAGISPAKALFISIQMGDTIYGSFSGSMFFDSGRTCEVSGSFNLAIE